MVKLNWLKDANTNLIQIYSYIYQDSIYYSVKTINDIVHLVNLLELSPYIGRKVPEYNQENLRELIYKSYRIIYEIQQDRIFIHRVWHSARILPKQLRS